MAEKRGKGRQTYSKIVGEEDGLVKDQFGENPSVVSALHHSESQLDRIRLRERWELASVLNFLHVFQPIIGRDVAISAEDIEMALITPNSVIAQLHVSLLKGIPPVKKSLTCSDAWVTELCKKLTMWWSWVAEGEIPLIAAHGEAISKYKELEPTTRLLILKALCEIRAYQDDILTYINDALKHGTQLSTFRKDRIGGDGNGTSYWYDGDSVIGHRLYREITKVEFKPRLKGKGRLTQPTTSFQWETLATNLEEFRAISGKLSCSKVMVETTVGSTVKNEILPVLEEDQKKKERALKRKQRQTVLLNASLNSYVMGNTRSCRLRRPVCYTFDEFDRSIDEAIQLTKKKDIQEQKHDDDKFREGDDDDNASDYDEKNDDDDDNDGCNSGSSETENCNLDHGTRPRCRYQKGPLIKDFGGLRRSKRTAEYSSLPVETRNRADTKERLRHRPILNNVSELLIVSDSEDESLSENISNEMSES